MYKVHAGMGVGPGRVQTGYMQHCEVTGGGSAEKTGCMKGKVGVHAGHAQEGADRQTHTYLSLGVGYPNLNPSCPCHRRRSLYIKHAEQRMYTQRRKRTASDRRV